MDTTKGTTMQPVTDATIVPEATAEFIAGLLERIEQLESDLATAEQDSRQKQARIERLEEEEESKQAALLDCLNEWKEMAKSAEKKCDALNAEIEARALQEPVAAQHRFRNPHKNLPTWTAWLPCEVTTRPAWEVDSQGNEVEYRALYIAASAKGE